MTVEEFGAELGKLVGAFISEKVREAVDGTRLLDVDGAADLLKMSPEAVRKSVERGQLPCIRVGRRIKFRRDELLAGVARASKAG